MAYYKAVIRGQFEGQEILNILWYRGVQTLGGALLAPTSGEDVAFQIHAEVGPAWLAFHPTTYTWVDTTVYAYDELLQLAFSQPHVRAMNTAGTAPGSVAGPAANITFRMNIAPLPLINVLYPKEIVSLGPTRGFLSMGPILEDWVGNDGRVPAAALASPLLTNLAEVLDDPLENLVPPAFFVPVRARSRRIAGLITLQGFGPVQSVAIRPVVTWRRSRMPEA